MSVFTGYLLDHVIAVNFSGILCTSDVYHQLNGQLVKLALSKSDRYIYIQISHKKKNYNISNGTKRKEIR